jgi:hypothetical protein
MMTPSFRPSQPLATVVATCVLPDSLGSSPAAQLANLEQANEQANHSTRPIASASCDCSLRCDFAAVG